MTQTAIPVQPYTAMTLYTPRTGVQVRYFPMLPVEVAREEFGPTVADARSFVLDTCCTECGVSRDAVEVTDRECQSCYVRGCDCVLREDDHRGDTYWCESCQPACGCRECCPD